jgi:hypothetical protein
MITGEPHHLSAAGVLAEGDVQGQRLAPCR